MLLESEKDAIVDEMSGLPHTFNGSLFNVHCIRAGEDVPRDDEDPSRDHRLDGYLLVFSFIPGKRKYGLSFNFFQNKRENPYYSNYAYGEDEYVVVRAFAKTSMRGDGRAIAQAWLLEMEKFIKTRWNKLINGGYIDRGSFSPYREIYSNQSDKQFGYEMMFKVVTTNSWTDEPEDPDDRIEVVPVEGVEGTIEDTVRIWVKI